MKVLVLHNRYRHPGGEDVAAIREIAMLRANGVDVAEHFVDNEGSNLKLLAESAWSRESYQTTLRLCREFRPDIVHVHNFWMRLTPSVHAAAHEAGAATVQTLHNYRLICANGMLLRDGKVCEDCVGRVAWRGIVRRCYHDSTIASAAAVRVMRSDVWQRQVDAFITPSESARSRLIHAAIPGERLFVKPNFVEDPGVSVTPPSASRRIAFAGRLSPEKGAQVLIAAWKQLAPKNAELVIVGDGALAAENVTFTGQLSNADWMKEIQRARAVVVPSICLETFGSTVIEAFACGRPALVSGLGALGELVRDGWNGLHFDVAALERVLGDDELADRLGRNARADYEARYTSDVNYRKLREIYEFATHNAGLEARATLLGTRVSSANYGEVLRQCRDWIAQRQASYVAILTVHSIMTAFFDRDFRTVLNGASLAVTDGMPLVWALRSFGVKNKRRVYGPDLMLALCGQAQRLGHRIFLYGGREETLPVLRTRLERRFPGLHIAGAYSPPFRPLTHQEDAAAIAQIRASEADIVFCGIGVPKQERWMAGHSAQLPGCVLLGVGAAFDFHAGSIRQAPTWMQGAGLEWLFRLTMEPARLWKRYVFLNPLFLVLWAAQFIRGPKGVKG